MQDYNGKITYTAFAPLFVIPTLLVVVPRCPARLRLPLFAGVVAVYGSFPPLKKPPGTALAESANEHGWVQKPAPTDA